MCTDMCPGTRLACMRQGVSKLGLGQAEHVFLLSRSMLTATAEGPSMRRSAIASRPPQWSWLDHSAAPRRSPTVCAERIEGRGSGLRDGRCRASLRLAPVAQPHGRNGMCCQICRRRVYIDMGVDTHAFRFVDEATAEAIVRGLA